MSSLPSAQLCRRFSLGEIQSATRNFDDALVVGKGGFGKVYKATIIVENGGAFNVAIKRMNLDSSQGATEFWAEVEMLTKLRHCNLVSLLGYCNDNSEMILIYDFMSNGTLDDHLHKYGTILNWVQRLTISIGVARGLHYLHTGTGIQHGVIHRDVKSTNILLDEDYAAKISDFGLAKVGPTNASSAYVNTVVRGTFGYLDPEYFWTGRLTRKSDVFAFGVVLFELLCGRAALDNRLDDDESSLVKWACESIKKGRVRNIIDLKIKSQICPKCLKVFVQTAFGCLSNESEKRPKMAEIVVALERSLSLQNKFDTLIKPVVGMSSISRMIKWPFISPEVNSAQSDTTPLTINEDTADQREVVPFHEMPLCLSHVAAQTKSLEKDCVNHASSSNEQNHEVSSDGKIQILAHEPKKSSFGDLKKATRSFRRNTQTLGHELKRFSFDDPKKATRNFKRNTQTLTHELKKFSFNDTKKATRNIRRNTQTLAHELKKFSFDDLKKAERNVRRNTQTLANELKKFSFNGPKKATRNFSCNTQTLDNEEKKVSFDDTK